MTGKDEAARRMGALAGRAFRDTGVPARNPFDGKKQDALAAAWRRAYFAELAKRTK